MQSGSVREREAQRERERERGERETPPCDFEWEKEIYTSCWEKLSCVTQNYKCTSSVYCTLGSINPWTVGLELDRVAQPNEKVLDRNWNLIILFVLTCLIHFHQYCIHLLGGEWAASLGGFSLCWDGFKTTTDDKNLFCTDSGAKCSYLRLLNVII